jgi:mono/diheme cytochrome c family protein
MTPFRSLALPALVVAGLALVGVLSAAEKYSAAGGQRTYKTYCANCHGVAAKGDGPIASSLVRPPSDLTAIAARSGGVFDADAVAGKIDGREDVKAHGPRDMPVWGDAFVWPEEDTPTRREQVRRRISELVEYLRTLQVPPAKG